MHSKIQTNVLDNYCDVSKNASDTITQIIENVDKAEQNNFVNCPAAFP